MKQNFIKNYDAIMDKINKKIELNCDEEVVNTILYNMSIMTEYKNLKIKLHTLKDTLYF